MAVFLGLRNLYGDMQSELDLLMPLGIAITLWWWAVCDSKDRGRPIPILARQWFFVGAPVLVPAYVIWSRRWRGLGLVVLHVICWYGLATAAMYVGWALAFGSE
jgi:hypothetical protein